MSKSEGNVIDPVDLIDGIALPGAGKSAPPACAARKKPRKSPKPPKALPDGIPPFGADAVRFTMASYASLGRCQL